MQTILEAIQTLTPAELAGEGIKKGTIWRRKKGLSIPNDQETIKKKLLKIIKQKKSSLQKCEEVLTSEIIEI